MNFGQIKVQYPLNREGTQKLPFYIVSIGAMENQHPCIRPEGLSDYHFLYCSCGSGHLIIEGKEYTLTAGMGMYFQPNIAHEYYAQTEPWTTHWIMFNGSAIPMIPSIQEMGRSYVFYIYNMKRLSLLHSNAYSCAEIDGLLNINEVSVRLYEFLLELSSCIGSSPKLSDDLRHNQLNNVITYIDTNFKSDITLKQLADLVGVTPQHLCRLFKNTYHMRPMEYLCYYRLKQAKRLLTSQTDLSLKEICYQIGYHDLSYFCALFKRSEGMTPIEFRTFHTKTNLPYENF